MTTANQIHTVCIWFDAQLEPNPWQVTCKCHALEENHPTEVKAELVAREHLARHGVMAA